MPNVSSLAIYSGAGYNLFREFESFRCREAQYSVDRPAPAEICNKHIFSIGAFMDKQALGESKTQIQTELIVVFCVE